MSRPATQVCELEVGHTSLDDGAARALASITRLRRLHLRRVGFTSPAGFPLLTALQARCPPASWASPGRAAAMQTVHMRLTEYCLPAGSGAQTLCGLARLQRQA